MFLDQSKKYPFPKVTPIRIPRIVSLANSYRSSCQDTTSMQELEETFRKWFQPLVDVDQFPYVYFMNNGITQCLEFLALTFKDQQIKMIQGDYFWLKTMKSAIEVTNKENCKISYISSPSAIDGSIIDTEWNSDSQILDGAYVGTSVKPLKINTNTEFLLLGFSKNLGFPEYRLGLLFSRKKIQSLEMFQKVFSHVGLFQFEIISKIVQDIKIIELAEELKHYQAKYCQLYAELTPSDSALLSTTTDTRYKFYSRPNGIIRVPLGESITHCLEQKII